LVSFAEGVFEEIKVHDVPPFGAYKEFLYKLHTLRFSRFLCLNCVV